MKWTPQVVLMAVTLGLPGFGADWNQHDSAQQAARYLDARQKAWSEWKNAAAQGGTCFSCHTNMTYMLARPLLRRALDESQPTSYETVLLAGLRTRALNPDSKKAAAVGTSVDSVMAALFLVREEAGKPALSAEAKTALDRMWALQRREGPLTGAWTWFNLTLDPWEMPESPFFGATLAAMAVGAAPAGYRREAEVQERVEALTSYLLREQSKQTLHARLMLVWASTQLSGLLAEPARRAILEELLSKQQPDGGWTLDALGEWKKHDDAPQSSGSNAYVTAFATFVLQAAGGERTSPKIARALDWLREHQDRESGAWIAESMNKHYEAGSMPLGFMRDAATGFAVLALLGR